MPIPHGFRDLKVYQLAYQLADGNLSGVEILSTRRNNQIRRASRSVAANIAEGYRKKRYPKMFVSKMADAEGEATETQVWLDFARDCGYLSPQLQAELTAAGLGGCSVE